MKQINNIPLKITREQVKKLLGEPDMVGGISNKYKTPSIYKYGHIELWFEPYKSGILYTIWDEKNEKIIKSL